MKSNQARVNMDTARDIQHDKSIKTKAEKDRRLKEKQSNNTKVDKKFYPFTFNCVQWANHGEPNFQTGNL